MVIITRPRDPSDPFYRAASTEYSQAYTSILKAARGATSSSIANGASPVLILVSVDIDALCAARSLTSLFAEDDIAHRICPVDGYATLNKIIEEDVVGNAGLHTIIMLNLGSLLSLPNYFTTPNNPMPDAYILQKSCSVHLIDSHRPYNLDNLFATSEMMDQIFVWDDGEIEERLGREEKAYTALEFIDDMSSSEEEDEDSEQEGSSSSAGESDDDSAENASQGSQRPKKRRKRRNDRGEGEPSPMPKTKKLPANILASHRNVLTRYYNRGTMYGMGVSAILFLLAGRLGRADNDCLWYAIVGLTSQYINSQIPHGHYEELAKSMSSDVRSLNPVTNRDGKGPAKPADADDGRIRVIQKELRFTLYRHWSLESSMYHSSYVAGKLGIWKERGVSKLRGLMAKMGLSLAQCRQLYEHMDLDLRQTLVSRIESIAPEYGLTECVFPSFMRTFGFRSSPMSAADTVDGLEALLCAAHGIRIEVDAPGLAFGGVGAGVGGLRGAYAAAMGEATQGSDMFGTKRIWQCKPVSGSSKDSDGRTASGAEDVNETQDSNTQSNVPSQANTYWSQNFFTAYNALDSRKTENVRLLRASLSLSKALHDMVIKQGVFIIEKQMIRTLRNFRLVILKDGPDMRLFTNVQLLSRLGFWLVDALRDIVEQQQSQKRKRRKGGEDGEEGDEKSSVSLPFVLAALDEARDRYTVVGINASMQYGNVVRNYFGLHFQEAATASHARTKHDQFESSAVEVRQQDFSAFVEELHGIL
ncbi:hypothetical protein L7F22_039423 [Adiantum nelumboides]|nr:hypothetical protein [Adiantum nelumboides]